MAGLYPQISMFLFSWREESCGESEMERNYKRIYLKRASTAAGFNVLLAVLKLRILFQCKQCVGL